MIKTNFKKIDIVKKLSLKFGFSKSYSNKLVNDILLTLKLLAKDEILNIKNIGSFKILNKKERIGRNPKTKQQFVISKRKTISFTASNKLLDKLNKKNG